MPEIMSSERELAEQAVAQAGEEQKQQAATGAGDVLGGLSDVVETVDAGVSVLSSIFEIFS